jgi:hypothetical protein
VIHANIVERSLQAFLIETMKLFFDRNGFTRLEPEPVLVLDDHGDCVAAGFLALSRTL